jgi:hypothetical protein
MKKRLMFLILVFTGFLSILDVSALSIDNEFNLCTLEGTGAFNYVECTSSGSISDDFYAIYIPENYRNSDYHFRVVYYQYVTIPSSGYMEISDFSFYGNDVNDWYIVDVSDLPTSSTPDRVALRISNPVLGGEMTTADMNNFNNLAFLSYSPLVMELLSNNQQLIDSSYTEGYEDGETSGYDFGYNIGYNAGFDAGRVEGFDGLAWLKTVFYFISALFNIEFIPNISIGTIAIFWLIVIVVPAILGIVTLRGRTG